MFGCRLKPNVTQSIDSWALALKLCCFPADDTRCYVVARVLSDNGLHNVERIVKAAPFNNWVRTEQLNANEQTALCELCRFFRVRRNSDK